MTAPVSKEEELRIIKEWIEPYFLDGWTFNFECDVEEEEVIGPYGVPIHLDGCRHYRQGTGRKITARRGDVVLDPGWSDGFLPAYEKIKCALEEHCAGIEEGGQGSQTGLRNRNGPG